MSLICIWAESQNRIIGKDGRLPWRISEELAQFKEKTLGHTLIFGYNTYQGFEGRKLPGRKMELYDPSLKDSIYERSRNEDIFIAGGKKTYEEFLDVTDRIIRTVIEKDFESDTLSPEVNWSHFELVKCKRFSNDEVSWKIEEWLRKDQI